MDPHHWAEQSREREERVSLRERKEQDGQVQQLFFFFYLFAVVNVDVVTVGDTACPRGALNEQRANERQHGHEQTQTRTRTHPRPRRDSCNDAGMRSRRVPSLRCCRQMRVSSVSLSWVHHPPSLLLLPPLLFLLFLLLAQGWGESG